MNCLGCGAEVPAGVKFCYSCGRSVDAGHASGDTSKILIQCTKCGMANQATYNVCVKCGESLRSARSAYARILADNPASVKRLCVECGADNPKSATHCGNCGKLLTGHFSHATDIYAVEEISSEHVDTVSRILLYILSLLIPMGGMIAGVILYVRSSDPESDYREVGKLCLLFAIISYVVVLLISVVASTSFFFWGFGG